MRTGVPLRRSTSGHVVRTEASTSITARGSRLTKRISPSGSSGMPGLQRSGPRPHVERVERVVRLGGGQQLAAADLDGAELAAHERLAPERAAAGEVDDRLEVRAHAAVRGTRGTSPCARGASSVSAASGAPAGRRAARRTGTRARTWSSAPSSVFSRSSQPGPASAGPRRRCRRRRVGGKVLDLVEHGRSVRQQPHAIDASLPPGCSLGASDIGAYVLIGAGPADWRDWDENASDRVGGALARHLDRAAERALGLLARPLEVELVGDVGERRAAARPRAGRARPPRRASCGRAGSTRSGCGSVASTNSRSVSRANSHRSSSARSRPRR